MPRVPSSVTAERRRRSWELSQQGWTPDRIALDLGVHRTTVIRYLTTLSKQTLARLEDEVIRVKAIQLRQYKHIIDEAFQAWEASKKPEKQVTSRKTPGTLDEDGNQEEPEETVTTTRVRGQTGDSRHLKTAMDAMSEIRTLLGMERPETLRLLTMDDVQKIFNQLPTGAQTAYLRLVEFVIGRGDGVPEEEPERIESRSGQTYFT